MASLGFQPMTYDQWASAVKDGSMAGATSPFLAQAVAADALSVAQQRNIDPRVLLAWLRSENNEATNISASLLNAHNGAGIKWIGQSRAVPLTQDKDGNWTAANGAPVPLAPASEGSVPYCVFATWADFFFTLAVNIQTILPDAWTAGNLARIASYYTTGNPDAGGGANKVTFYTEYLSAYPAGGSVTDSGVYGEDIIAALVPHLGEMNSTGALDPWNTPAFPNHPWAGWCESMSEGAQYAAGLTDVVHRGSAALKLDAVTAQGLLQTSWPPEDGAICLWGRNFDPQGHTDVWSAAKGMWISTLYPPHPGLDYFYSDAWKAAMAGWYRAPGVVAANRPTPLPAPVPPQTPFFVDGNPNGPIPVRGLFWGRWDALNTMGAKLDHPGAVNPVGLALPTFGYPVEAERTLPTGRRIQKFERVYLAVDKGAAPFDVVVLLLSEQPA